MVRIGKVFKLKMKRFCTFAVTLTLASLSLGQTRSEVDVAFVIDCSTSMTYALDGAKAKIVDVVKKVEAEHKDARIRVGFISYGQGTTAYKMLDFTDNPAEANRFLANLKMLMGTKELPGFFIEKAATQLHWTKEATKLIYVVGNETPHQGPPESDVNEVVPFWAVNGYTISAIYAGYGGKAKTKEAESRRVDEVSEWSKIADMGHGEFINLSGSK